MQDKLQQLTDRLYNEGLSKGKAEGGKLLEQARDEAAKILSDAREEAAGIIEAARKEAESLKAKASSDVKMASEQSLQAVKNSIESLLSGKAVGEKIGSALSEEDFLKTIIAEIARKFSSEQSCELSLVLPEKMKEAMEPWLAGELSKVLDKGVRASFSKKIAGGFEIGPSDGSYFISLTDESFRNLICEYLRPTARKLLFGE